MKRILLAAAAVALAASPVFAQSSGSGSMSSSAPNATPMVDVANAKIEGNKITGITAQIDKPGYIVIHDKAAGAPPASLGHMALDKGKTGDISIEADSALDPANGISLMLHYETNNNKTYDFGPGSTDVDTPVKVGDTVVNQPLKAGM